MTLHAIFSCPSCRSDEDLFEHVTVPGTRGVTSTLAPSRGQAGRIDVDTINVDLEDRYGCGACEWEGARIDLLLDGQDQHQIPGQLPLAS